MIDLAYVNWIGASGLRYAMEINPLAVEYNDRPGVYIFCRSIGSDRWGAIYVGQAGSFETRISASVLALHHRYNCIRAAGATHVCTLHVPDGDAKRFEIETDLRRALDPHCNRQ